MAFGLRLPNPASLFVDTVLGGDAPGAPAVTITELTGAQRSIVLRGRALPYRGASWGASMRVKTTWYQGNPVATQQILGPELEPTALRGVWKDRFLTGAQAEGGESAILVNGSPDEIRSAEAAVQLFYDVLNSGNRLRVVWGSEVREGILVGFVPTYERLQDVAWELEFEWSSRGRGELRAVEEPESADDLLQNINSLDDILGFSPEEVAARFNAQLLDTVDSVRESVGTMFSALRALDTVLSTPASVVGAVDAAATSIRLELTEEIGRLTEHSIGGSRQGASVTVRAASVMQVEAFRRTTARRGADVRAAAMNLNRQTQARAKPREVRMIPVPEGATLYAISNRYYGSPDFANFLMRVNGLTTAVPPAGFLLRIPPRPAVDDGGTATGFC